MAEQIVTVAGIAVRFRGDAAAIALVEQRFGAFARSESGPVHANIEVRVRRDDLSLDESREAFALVEEEPGGLRVFAGAGVRAQVAADWSNSVVDTPPAMRAIDALFRLVLAGKLLDRGGLLLHASSVVMADMAWVFSGPSGVGKSTLASHLPGQRLADETIALVPGRRGDVLAHGTPYWQGVPMFAPVAGALFPARGLPQWRDLSAAAAVARVISQVGPLVASDLPRALQVAGCLLQRLQCAEICMAEIGDIGDWLAPQLRDKAARLARECSVSAADLAAG